ncbi:ATP-grasp domain-containing protein [Sorangium sp. So ce1389]|uniref:ATP-grasp domain-containing protein n=1 Tax=Sorangium sp. So ce1389 TaxID=3133336 RepID=UPI003F6275AD
MKILVMHTVPYKKIDYHRALDHEAHDVTYVGTAARIADLPAGLRCDKLVIPGVEERHVEIGAVVSPADGHEMVMALSEFDLHEAGKVREHLGIPGPRYSELLRFKDKILMKRLVAAAGLRSPRHLDLRTVEKGAAVAPVPWEGRTILKPTLGASSVGVRVFSSPGAARAFLARPENHEYLADGELEEFVEGPILHVDGVMDGGAPRLIVASRYVGTPLEYAWGKPLGSAQLRMSDRYRAFFLDCLRAVGIVDGAFHLEVIEGPEDLVFMEVANRAGGGDIIPTTEASTGVHIPTQEIDVLIRAQARRLGRPLPGGPVREVTKTEGPWFGWLIVPGHHFPEASCRVTTPDWLQRSDAIVKLRVARPADRLKKSVTHQYWEVPAAAILRGESDAEVVELVRRLIEQIRVAPRAAQVVA